MDNDLLYDPSFTAKISNIIKLIADVPYYTYLNLRTLIVALLSFILPQKSKTLNGETLLITGGASGVGRSVALQIAKKTHKVTLVLWDINEVGLRQTAEECINLGAKVYYHVVDLNNRQDIALAAKKVRNETDGITILFNNAGVVYVEPFLTADPVKEEAVIKTNLISYMWITKEFLPEMIQRGKGHIVSTCSGLSLSRHRNVASYVASKYGLQGFIESLRLEMKLHPAKPKIKLGLVFPGFVKTPMTNGFSWKPRYNWRFLTLMEPEYVAEEIVQGIEKETDEIMIPRSLQYLSWLYRLTPTDLIDDLENHVYKDLDISRPNKPSSKNGEEGAVVRVGGGGTERKVGNNN